MGAELQYNSVHFGMDSYQYIENVDGSETLIGTGKFVRTVVLNFNGTNDQHKDSLNLISRIFAKAEL